MQPIHRSLRLAAATLALPAVLVIAGTQVSHALDLPCSSARLIVPFGAGGHSDINARILADAVNALGAEPQWQVVNIAGQAGNRGSGEALAADPDGCTLFMTHQSIVSAYLTGRVDYTWSDYTPVAAFTTTPVIIGASADAPFSDLAGLEAYAKEHPDEVLTGVTLGSTSHFSVAEMATRMDVELKYVSYDGTPERMQALLSGVIQLGELTEGTAQQYLSSGELKGLAILGEARSPRLEDLPTAIEQGYDVTVGNTLGVVAPKGTPDDVVAYYADLIEQATSDPEVAALAEGRGSYVTYMDPAAYADWWSRANESWTEVAKFVGIYAAPTE